MNPAVALALILSLYEQNVALQQKVAALEAKSEQERPVG